MTRNVAPSEPFTFPVWSAQIRGRAPQDPAMVMVGRETYNGFIVDHRVMCDSDEQAQQVYRALAASAETINTLTDAIRFGDDQQRMLALRTVAA